MHRTPSADRRQALQKEALKLARDARALQKVASVRQEAERLQGEADAALAEAEALKLQARLEDLTVWQMKRSSRAARAARPTATGWPPRREGGKTRRPPGVAGRWMPRKPARRPGRGRRRRWVTVEQKIDDRAWPGSRSWDLRGALQMGSGSAGVV
jgi:hypothetical protein